MADNEKKGLNILTSLLIGFILSAFIIALVVAYKNHQKKYEFLNDDIEEVPLNSVGDTDYILLDSAADNKIIN